MEKQIDTRLLGQWGEDKVCEFLRKKRCKIIGRNFSCRFGEIDIIAKNRKYISFVEVKLRKNDDYAKALEFVTPAKQKRIILAAEYWLQKNPTDLQPRFDVAEVYAPEGVHTPKPEINYLEDAFQL